MGSNKIWSPFIPDWYESAFDKYTSTAESLFNSSEIIKEGYRLPDADGSRSSAFRADAVLNNSFSEEGLRESLRDIYLNNSHKLMASNHDNTHFYKWSGHMADTSVDESSLISEIKLPTNGFIAYGDRDKYKLSQFHNRWIKSSDILKNWDTFKWDCLLFINGKSLFDYEIRIEEQETTVRFQAYSVWVKKNAAVMFCKFDTSIHCLVKIAPLQMNKWEWKIPLSYVDSRVGLCDHVMLGINRISDPEERVDGMSTIDSYGDNMEFVPVTDGFIDMTNISEYNQNLIVCEENDWLWLSIIVPKYMHEYPIFITSDIIYRPFQSNRQRVYADANGEMYPIKADASSSDPTKNVYINVDGDGEEWDDGWRYVLRPIVLSDAYDAPDEDPYESLRYYVTNLTKLTVEASDIVQGFHNFMDAYTTDDEFLKWCDKLEDVINRVHEADTKLFEMRQIPLNTEYEKTYKDFMDLMTTLRINKNNSSWFHQQFGKHNDFWEYVSRQIWMPRKHADRYYVSNVVNAMGNPRIWDPVYVGQQRFRRPIDVSDFWIFEGDPEKNIWRPVEMTLTHHFPDVYTLSYQDGSSIPENKIFKAFFFYSDTMNIREPVGDIIKPTPAWDTDMENYEYNRDAVYRDIFMEKFYWMGIKSIYKGIVQTQYRWELIEYIQDNKAYQRFNDLFLHTMDPYFKMGMATYLKSDNYEFPFDDAVAKLNEAMTTKFNGYTQVTNFEIYLNNTWIPSYFDFITEIMDDWDYEGRLVKRPRDTYDHDKVMSVIKEMYERCHDLLDALSDELAWIQGQIDQYEFNVSQSYLSELEEELKNLISNIDEIFEFANNLDLDIYSIEDLNHLRSLIEPNLQIVEKMNDLMYYIRHSSPDTTRCEKKLEIVRQVRDLINIDLDDMIRFCNSVTTLIDIEEFMKYINDPAFFQNGSLTGNNSLIGYINRFTIPWPISVKNARDALFISTKTLYEIYYNPSKSYTRSEAEEFSEQISIIAHDITQLSEMIDLCYNSYGYTHDVDVDNAMAYAINAIGSLQEATNQYIETQARLFDVTDQIRSLMVQAAAYNVSSVESDYISEIDEYLDQIIKALSYMVGSNDKSLADDVVRQAYEKTLEWIKYIGYEIDLYERLIKMSGDPNPYMEDIVGYAKYMQSMSSYIGTMDHNYIPQSDVPTYADVYEATGVNVLTGGFMHEVGDNVYVPDIGSYTISEFEGDNGSCKSLEALDYRRTTFSDPMWNSNPFDSVTDGIGMGITVQPTGSTKIPIVNDSVVSNIGERIRNLFTMIGSDIDVVNPYNNAKMRDNVVAIETIKEEWDSTLSFYTDHMSSTVREATDNLVNRVCDVVSALNNLIDTRAKCDVGGFINEYYAFIVDSYTVFNNAHMLTQTYVYYDGRMRSLHQQASEFYGNGATWDDVARMKQVIDNCIYELNIFYKNQMARLPDSDNKTDLVDKYNALVEKSNVVKGSVEEIYAAQDIVRQEIEEVKGVIDEMPTDIQVDHWYRFYNVSVGDPGMGYKAGDIVRIIPELPKDQFGNEIHDQEDLIMNDYILIRITRVENGQVKEISPLMDYAIPYQIFGIRNTEHLSGKGVGLIVNAYSTEVNILNSSLFYDPSSDAQKPQLFDRNDLFKFKFENIHDLGIVYEVFLNGKQKLDFIQRRESTDDPLHPENVDVIYLNANEVMELANSAVDIEGEHYFVYRLDSVDIIDSGKGYTKGQNIYVDAGETVLKLKVNDLKKTPYKEIASIEIGANQNRFKGIDPASDNAKAINDMMDNIDDEFHVSDYDKLTSDGINRGASLLLDKEEYPFISHRHDSMDVDERNETFMHPDVELPSGSSVPRHGDPDGHWYLGSRENYEDDQHFWYGIMNIIPPTDAFIPRDQRIPTGQPIRGEYQYISRIQIHGVSVPILTSIPDDVIESLVKGTAEPQEQEPYAVHDFEIDGIPVEKVEGLTDGSVEPSGVPMIEVDGELIKAVDQSKIKPLIYGELEPVPIPGPYVDEHIMSQDVTNKDVDIARDNALLLGDRTVPDHASMPQHLKEWPDARIGNTLIVEADEEYGGHRMMYRVRSYYITGYILYDEPEYADWAWNEFDVDWLVDDYYPDLPSVNAQYPSDLWYTSDSYRKVHELVEDGSIERVVTPRAHAGTFIDSLSVNDLSVYNFTLHQWEDLTDPNKWGLEVYNDGTHFGFKLKYLEAPEQSYSYDMRLYLNKIPDTQKRNAALKQNASFKIQSSIESEVNTKSFHYNVNTGRHLRIRKLFPYEERQTGVVTQKNNIMKFSIEPYPYYRNEIHAEDILLYNKTANRYEDIMDSTMFELDYKDPKATARGYETQTTIVQSMIAKSGESFVNGVVWCYNKDYDVHLFANVEADYMGDGAILKFIPLHCPNPPLEDVTLEFEVYQFPTQRSTQAATVLVEFQTQKIRVAGNGYLKVTNPLAPVKDEFRVIVKYNIDQEIEYEMRISKSPKIWKFMKPSSELFPTFYVPDRVPADRLYIVTDKGRVPLINPATDKPSFFVTYTDDGMDIMFLNVYEEYTQLEIHSTPYPMRSVFTARKIPQSGYIDLEGRLNKPLNKKYFEFWMNGRLLNDEVTIISPTKIFLHGLRSLRNFEIIEINRDPNEYFSDAFLGVDKSGARPFARYNYTTYLDDALEGNLEGDNYRVEEQETLLTPVWRQVDHSNPEYKNFPPNMDIEDDVLLRVDDYVDMNGLTVASYMTLISDAPSIEGVPLYGATTTWEMLGFQPMTDDEILGMLDEEWREEIEKGLIPRHAIISETSWYGMATRMYDEYGLLVNSLDGSAYHITSEQVLRVEETDKEARLIRNNTTYDLD